MLFIVFFHICNCFIYLYIQLVYNFVVCCIQIWFIKRSYEKCNTIIFHLAGICKYMSSNYGTYYCKLFNIRVIFVSRKTLHDIFRGFLILRRRLFVYICMIPMKSCGFIDSRCNRFAKNIEN